MSTTKDRVPAYTPQELNEEIRERTRMNIEYYSSHKDEIDRRLAELDLEWDIERSLEVNSSALTLFGLLMGLGVNKKWLFLPIAVQTFFMQHALQGWCPPLPFLRKLGVRTLDEINYERYALKIMRGDFEGIIEDNTSVSPAEMAGVLLQAVRQ